MTDPTATPPPTTGRGARAPTDSRYLRDRLEGNRTDIRRIQNNRTPVPLRLPQQIDTPLLAGGPLGHSATYDANAGAWVPSPNLAVLTFDLIGTVVTGLSPPHWSRYDTRIVGVAFLLGTTHTAVDFELLLNSSSIFSGTAGASPSHNAIDPSVALPAYANGLLQINVTSAGSGNSDLIVQVELGSEVAGQPGPVPWGGV